MNIRLILFEYLQIKTNQEEVVSHFPQDRRGIGGTFLNLNFNFKELNFNVCIV